MGARSEIQNQAKIARFRYSLKRPAQRVDVRGTSLPSEISGIHQSGNYTIRWNCLLEVFACTNYLLEHGSL